MTFPFRICWFVAALAALECEGATLRLSWLGTGTVGDNRYGLHSIIPGETGPATYLELPALTASVGVHGETVYYAQSYTDFSGSSVFKTDLQGGGQTPLYEIPRRNTSWGFVITGSHLYLSDSLNDTISRSDLEGRDLVKVFQSGYSPSPAYLAGTADHLFWLQFAVSDAGKSSIWRLDHANPGGATMLLGSLSEPRHLSATASNLFWFDSMDRVIYRSDHNGRNRQSLVTGTWARGMVADENYLYWANNTLLLRSDHDGNNIETLFTSGNLIGSLFLQPIPEPETAVLGIIGGMLLVVRRRRTR